jgi:hypothetical protein
MRGTITQKQLLIIAIIFLILIPFIVLFKSNTQQSPAAITQNSTPTETPATQANVLTSLQGNSYKVSYPNGWTSTTRQLSNNTGNIVILHPEMSNSYNLYTITIEELNSQIIPISTLTTTFAGLHYTDTPTVVAGITAQKYSAILQTPNGNLHSIAYVFENNEKIYYLKLEYIQPIVNEELETQFNQLINSFTIQ